MFDGVSGVDGVPSASRFTVFTSETISKEDSYSIFGGMREANFPRSSKSMLNFWIVKVWNLFFFDGYFRLHRFHASAALRQF